jgi:hypothetical protein
MPPLTPFGVALIMIAVMPLVVALSIRIFYPRLAPRQSHDFISALSPDQIFALAEDLFPKRGVFGYGRWWARTTPAPQTCRFATYPVPYISFGGLWIVLMGRSEQVTIRATAQPGGTHVQISARGYAAQDQGYLLREQIVTLEGIPAAAIQTAPDRQATIIADGNGWCCSACQGYVRQDATICKHCKQPLTSLQTTLTGLVAQARQQQATPIIANGTGWRCGVCQGYVRRDATICKHCGHALRAPVT